MVEFVSRRSFLIGSAASVAALTLPVRLLASDVVKTITEPHYRRVYDIMFSSLMNRDGMSEFTVKRDGSTLMLFQMNWRACLRWVAAPRGELVFPPHSAMEFVVEPCFPTCHLQLFCEDARGERHSEVYKWKNNVAVLAERTILDPLSTDEYAEDPTGGAYA